ncbi:hypothetical protein ACF0H5_006668 [Mactra antiquata]
MQPAVLCLSCLVIIVTIIQYVSAEVMTFDVPRPMAECFWRLKKKTNTKRTPAVAIQSFCENQYNWHNHKLLNVNRGANPNTIQYINGLCKNTKEEIKHFRMRRKKRQAGGGPPKKLRVRKEIRMMSDKEFQLYVEAVNSAKRNTSISPNKYDALAEFHTGMTSVSAHGGCNFHGWHRMYILMYENALREEGPEFADVTVPYWDSTMDDRMEDPELSVLFSDRFLGSCQGEAKGGMMKEGWTSSTGAIVRNCKTDGPLMNMEMIKNVTRHNRFEKICGEDSAIDDDLEFHHNGVHRWIDGQMAMLVSSVYDPIFWLHHAFIDYIWEKFRDNQKRGKVDPETDYPVNPVTMGAHELHLPDARMGFSELSVIDGLSEMFTTEWYKYAPSPTCTWKKQDCGSKYLKCVEDTKSKDRKKNDYVCVGRTLAEVIAYEEEMNRPTPVPCIPDHVTHPPIIPGPHNHTTPIILPPKVIQPVQNTFCMNGKSDTAQWVYVPVKIILKRPPDYTNYGSYPVHRGKIEKAAGDIYSPKAYSNIYRHLRKADSPAKYDHCIEPDTPTNTIYVKSVGLNYEGVYKEYAIMDKRLAITVATAYLAVRKPMGIHDTSVSMFHAQDSCGRVCKPICKVPGTEIFRPCSGAIKITGNRPLQFGNSFGDAVLDVWDFDSDKDCPQLTTNSIIVSFYCDYSTDWIWPSVEPIKKTNKHVTVQPPPEKTTVMAGCSLGYGCDVAKPCGELRTCQNGAVVECLKSCHVYAQCFNNRYMLYKCRRGERYLRGQGCVSSRENPCDYKTSGLNRWNRNRGNGRNKRNNRPPAGR